MFAIIIYNIKCSCSLLFPVDPNIDAVWYKDRGIRPVGRFGRRMAQRGEGSYFGKHTFCHPELPAVNRQLKLAHNYK